MEWELLFHLYLKDQFARKSALILNVLREPIQSVHLKPDLHTLKTAYDLHGRLHLADVKPAGLLVQSKA
jgi:hypothetical protein